MSDTYSARKGKLIIQAPPGTKIHIQQTEHEFWFGTAVNASLFLKDDADPDKQKYLEILKQNFNSAVHENSLKWYGIEKEKDNVIYEPAEQVFNWCSANGIRMRGHCVFWEKEEFVQKWIQELGDVELKKRLRDRAFDLLTRFKGRIHEYDVNNEMVDGHYYKDRFGKEIWKDMFAWCGEADPDADLFMNDYSIISGDHLEKYCEQIEELLEMGADIGGIGVQAHFFDKKDGEFIQNALDRLAQFNLPVRVTEYDRKSDDENDKAEMLETVYRTCFAHPSVTGILMWGFWAGRHWLGNPKWGFEGYTAVWDKEWNITLSGEKYQELRSEWTTDLMGETDGSGILEADAYFGKYRIRTNETEVTANLKSAEGITEVVLG